MFLFRCVLLGLGFLGTYLGYSSFQEGSGIDMSIGAAGIAVALLCFFVLFKALWRILGCMATFVIVACIVGGICYFLYSSGILNKLSNVTADKKTVVTQNAPADGEVDEIQALLNKIPEMLDAGEKEPEEAPPQGPKQIPIVVGKVAQVAAGDLFRINNVWVRLFGIAAPLPKQTCMNKNGRSYACGRLVMTKLKEIVGEDEITCVILGTDVHGAAVSTCTIMKDYDLGVVLVEEGLAVALRNITPVYIPYENEARAKKTGLWEGSFFMPWEWLDQQKQAREAAANVKMPKPVVKKKTKKSIFDFF